MTITIGGVSTEFSPSITVGDPVRRKPGCYSVGALPPSDWMDDEGVVTKVERSPIFGCVVAKVRWKHFESEVEVTRLEKVAQGVRGSAR